LFHTFVETLQPASSTAGAGTLFLILHRDVGEGKFLFRFPRPALFFLLSVSRTDFLNALEYLLSFTQPLVSEPLHLHEMTAFVPSREGVLNAVHHIRFNLGVSRSAKKAGFGRRQRRRWATFNVG
jgi:hypothetical protein